MLRAIDESSWSKTRLHTSSDRMSYPSISAGMLCPFNGLPPGIFFRRCPITAKHTLACLHLRASNREATFFFEWGIHILQEWHVALHARQLGPGNRTNWLISSL